MTSSMAVALVGKRVEVWWVMENKFFPGIVNAYERERGVSGPSVLVVTIVASCESARGTPGLTVEPTYSGTSYPLR